jgi:hypothetical protein
MESVDFGKECRVGLAIDLSGLSSLFIPDIGDPLKEEQRQDVALPVGAVDSGTTQDIGGFPKATL